MFRPYSRIGSDCAGFRTVDLLTVALSGNHLSFQILSEMTFVKVFLRNGQ